jgi:hypothetical protein
MSIITIPKQLHVFVGVILFVVGITLRMQTDWRNRPGNNYGRVQRIDSDVNKAIIKYSNENKSKD